ncbi:MAG: hypothetical protein WCF16_04035 [Alphaproteobacteria bacterium]
MSARLQPVSVSATQRRVPFDLETADRNPGWRDNVAWPVPASEFGPVVLGASRSLIAFLGTLPEGEARAAALLAAPLILSRAGALILAAKCLEGEAATGVHLAGGPSELSYLRGESPAETAMAPLVEGAPLRPVRAAALRRLARMWTWTGPLGLAAAWLAPEACAVGHNDLLVKVARERRVRLGYDHAHLLFRRLRTRSPAARGGFDVAPVARAMVQVVTAKLRVDAPLRARLDSLIEDLAVTLLRRAADDLAALRDWRGAPRALWSANGGYYPARALALEVLRRGGEVTGFAHGGGTGLVDTIEPLALGDLAVATRFVVATPGIAAYVRALGGPAMVAPLRAVEVVGDSGNPLFAGLGGRASGLASAKPPAEPGMAGRRKVLYVSTALCGFRTLMPPSLPDPVYLDWVMRLAGWLRERPVDLLCQPHPEGLYYRRRHPLSDVAPTNPGTFEEVMSDRDVFVFDWPHSTTFWKALCTDKPIVFIDLGLSGFAPGVADLIARRCRVVRATYDHRNLPQVDWRELEEAVRGAPAAADGAPFRRLLAGED